NSFFFFLMSIGVLFQRVAGNLLAARFGPLSEVPAMYLVLTLLRVAGWTLADVVSRMMQPYIVKFAVEDQLERIRKLASLTTKLTCVIVAVVGASVWIG